MRIKRSSLKSLVRCKPLLFHESEDSQSPSLPFNDVINLSTSQRLPGPGVHDITHQPWKVGVGSEVSQDLESMIKVMITKDRAVGLTLIEDGDHLVSFGHG